MNNHDFAERVQALESLWHRYVATRKDSFVALHRLSAEVQAAVTGYLIGSHHLNPISGIEPSREEESAFYHAVHKLAIEALTVNGIAPEIAAESSLEKFLFPNGRGLYHGTWPEVRLHAYWEHLMALHRDGGALRATLRTVATKLVSAFGLARTAPKETARGTELVFKVARDEFQLKQGVVRMESGSADFLRETLGHLGTFLKHVALMNHSLSSDLEGLHQRFLTRDGLVLTPMTNTRLGSAPDGMLVIEKRTHLAFYLMPGISAAFQQFVSEFATQFNRDDLAA